MRITTGATVHDNAEIEAVLKVLKTSTQLGDNTYSFENRISQLFSKKYGIAVNSGSSALLLAGLVLSEKFTKKKVVITPVLTFSTTVASIIQSGFIPRFVDVDPLTYNIDEGNLEEQVDENVVGLWIPNLMGNLPNIKVLSEIAKKYNLFYLEDSADALGSKFNGHPTGFYTDFSTTSFYGSHIINCAGNGGMLCLNNDNDYNLARLLRSWGRSSSVYSNDDSEQVENRFNFFIDEIEYDKKYVFEKIGYNFEPNELGSAFGLVQLNKLDINKKIRMRNFKFLCEMINEFSDYLLAPMQNHLTETAWLSFPITIKENKNFNRSKLQIFLERNQIQTRTVFTGNILRQPGFKHINHANISNKFENADNIMKNSFLIGLHHGIDEEGLNYIKNTFLKFFKEL